MNVSSGTELEGNEGDTGLKEEMPHLFAVAEVTE